MLTWPRFGTKMIPRSCALHQRAICGLQHQQQQAGGGKERCYNFTELLQLVELQQTSEAEVMEAELRVFVRLETRRKI